MNLIGGMATGIHASVKIRNGPEHDRSLVEELEPHVQLEEWGWGNEEQIIVGCDIVGFERCHEGRYQVWWVEGLEIHNCGGESQQEHRIEAILLVNFII